MRADERGSETSSGREDTGGGSGRRHVRPFLHADVKREKRTYGESKPVGKEIPVLFRKLGNAAVK